MGRRPNVIRTGFEPSAARILIADIQPLKLVTNGIKKSPKFRQISASVAEVGLVEAPVVFRDKKDPTKFLLLDGHLRIEVLKELGQTAVNCLIATDDEAYTYNRHVNRIAIIQEHRMISKAIERGVSEERIAKSLNVDIGSIQRKRRLLEGICPEAAELLKDKHVAIHAFAQLRKLSSLRQIEAAELMIAMNNYTIGYAKSIVLATPEAQLAQQHRPKKTKGLSSEQVSLMERESANLEREFKIAEQSYGADHLDLVLATGYLKKLLGNPRVVRFLAQHQQEILIEFQKLTENEAVAR